MMNITRHKKQINRIIACQTDRQTEDVRMILLRLITAILHGYVDCYERTKNSLVDFMSFEWLNGINGINANLHVQRCLSCGDM